MRLVHKGRVHELAIEERMWKRPRLPDRTGYGTR